jgi:hypothetical protein
MKSLSVSLKLSLAVLALLGLSSCENRIADNPGSGTITFALSYPGSDSKSVTDSTNTSYHVMVSVEDMDSNAVFTDKLIPVYIFGNEFISENIELKAGEYTLTKFMVINASGEVIFAAPCSGAPLAYLINKPLPLMFKIEPNQLTRVMPEVLAVEDHSPGDFGYAAFGIQVVKPLDFWTMCVLDPGNPLIMAPIQITSAKLTVIAPDGWHYSFMLEPRVNHLIIRGGYGIYTFLVEKEGYLPLKLQFEETVLAATTPENPLILSIDWNSQMKKLVLQPGPELGKDAMISNLQPDKNFGDHKYFEATFLSEPVLTVMRSNRSLIEFSLDSLPKSAQIKKVILNLTYDLPIPFDSSFVIQPQPSEGIIWYGGVLQQIIEPWDEHKVTWNTQPKTTQFNQVYIGPFIRNVNFIGVDVTRLFVSPSTTDQAVYPNYGMLFRLWPVDMFPGFRFASSDYPLTTVFSKMWPTLTVYFTTP